MSLGSGILSKETYKSRSMLLGWVNIKRMWYIQRRKMGRDRAIYAQRK
jgi:hypothetical protein